MNNNIPYQPIACSLYDVLEAAAIRRHPLLITIGGIEETYIVENLFSKGTEEFLVARSITDDRQIMIRLDRVELIVDPADKKSYVASRC